jgi:hypothetical protein
VSQLNVSVERIGLACLAQQLVGLAVAALTAQRHRIGYQQRRTDLSPRRLHVLRAVL